MKKWISICSRINWGDETNTVNDLVWVRLDWKADLIFLPSFKYNLWRAEKYKHRLLPDSVLSCLLSQVSSQASEIRKIQGELFLKPFKVSAPSNLCTFCAKQAVSHLGQLTDMEKIKFLLFWIDIFFHEDTERVQVMGSGTARPHHWGNRETAYFLVQVA